MSPKHVPRDRTWGTRYDTLDISPPSSPPAQRSATTEPPHTPITTASDRDHPSGPVDGETSSTATTGRGIVQDTTPHDASIFVGSLPASVEHGELTRRLSDHLSAYSHIKAIKVVRDSRGGVCAFVQCESPSAAGSLLQSLQTDPPRPFLGRFLRFEPAKAFRTLLISYRAPPWPTPLSSSSFSTIADGQSTSSRLASAMRIFRPKSGKYLGLLYDADAIHYTAAAPPDGSFDSTRQDPFSGDGLLVQPLHYDAETLQKVASAFGPLECFEKHLVETEEPTPVIPSLYPSPHDAPRSPEMATGIWEVKWKDREDSVVALLTLRRVPHLTVSWAHHPAPTGAPSGGLLRLNTLTPPASWTPGRGRHFDGRFFNGGTHLSLGRPLVLHTPAAMGSHAFVSPTPSPKTEAVRPSTWTVDTTPSPSTRFGRAGTSSAPWADQVTEFYEGNATSLSSLSIATSASGQTTIDGSASVSRPPAASSPIHSHCKASSVNLSVTSGSDADYSQADANALLRERTTEIAISPTQLKLHVAPQLDQVATNGDPVLARDWCREIDPSTVFVGGLDMPGRETWDENKLRRIFDRFGTVENVHIVRPLNKRTAFAFVRFSSAESAIHAVQEEHNRVYDGYPIRVQLRDRSATSRGIWRPGRGRGRASVGPQHNEREPPTYSSVPDFAIGGVQAMSLPAIPADRSRTSSQEPTSPRSVCDSSPPPDQIDDSMRPRSLQDTANSSTSSVSSSTTKVPSLRYENSQGASSTTASSTPPPSTSVSTSVSSSLPVAPYPMNMGYFTPQPWAQPYGPPYPYAVPVVPGYGYAGYPYPSVQPLPSAFFARDTGLNPTASLSGAVWTTSATDRTYKDMAGCNTSRPLGHVNAHQQMMQPPLRATGFIQNEHGTLIPVYQREALDQYMANAHGRQLPPSQFENPPQPGPALAAANGTTWHQPAALPLCPGGYPVSIPAVGVAPPPSLHPPVEQRFWGPYGAAALPATNHLPVSTPLLPPSLAPVSPPRAPPLCRPHVTQRNGPPPRRLARRDHYHAQETPNNGSQNNVTSVDYSRQVPRNNGHNGHHYRRPQAPGC